MIWKRQVALPFVIILGVIMGFIILFIMAALMIGPPDKKAEAKAEPAKPAQTYYRCPPKHVLVTRSDMFEQWMCIPGVAAELSPEPFPKEDGHKESSPKEPTP